MQDDAYVCRGGYWVEFVPVEDCYGAAAQAEDTARRSRGDAAGRECLSDGGDLTGGDGGDDSCAEAVSQGGATACGGQGSCGGDERDAGCAERGGVYGVGEGDDGVECRGDLGFGRGPANSSGRGDA